MNNVTISKKNASIMRGTAIMFVFLSHITAKVLPLTIARLFTPFGGIGVAIFLFLSGYGLTIRYRESLKGYWYNRFVGTFLPYFLVWGITIWMRKYDSLKVFIADFFALSPLVTYFWYLGYLLIWYISFFLGKRFVKNVILRYLFYMAIGVLILVFGKELWAEQAFIFLLGCLFAEDIDICNKMNEVIRKNAIKVTIVLAVIGISCLGIKQFSSVRNAPYILFSILQMFIKTPLALSVILLVGEIKWRFINQPLMFIGNLSYELYLVHSIIIGVFDFPRLHKIFAMLLFVIATVVLSYVLKGLCNVIKKILKRTESRYI